MLNKLEVNPHEMSFYYVIVRDSQCNEKGTHIHTGTHIHML